MSVASAPGPGMRQVDLSKLSLQQLAQLKQQLDHELSVFQDSLQTLKIAQGKFTDSGDCLEKVAPKALGKTLLVPLTGSMYVTGTLVDASNVIIDIGTGYYAQKDVEGAKDYFKRRTKFVTEQMVKIQGLGLEKSKIRDAICAVIEMKMQAQAEAQKAGPS